jgi:hypothetical protein
MNLSNIGDKIMNKSAIKSTHDTCDNQEVSNNQHEQAGKKKLEVTELFDSMYNGYGPNATDATKKAAVEAITLFLFQTANEHKVVNDYNIIIMYDPTQMIKGDADHVYDSLTRFTSEKPLLMILYSKGGDIGAAYLIGKLCREHSNNCFVIAVPRIAKSAATLLACAADEIHMGSLSELGPIDPQIDQLPALGLKNSIEHIAQLVKKTPEASEMFAKYLHSSLKLIDLGYYERVAESAMQYAERLLATHSDKLDKPVTDIANELVYSYKDHGFVIDKTEAMSIFGPKIIKYNTPIYSLANEMYKTLNLINSFLIWLNHTFYFIGSLDSEPHIEKKG